MLKCLPVVCFAALCVACGGGVPAPSAATSPTVSPPAEAPEDARAKAIGSRERPLDASSQYAIPNPALRIAIVGTKVGSINGTRLGEKVVSANPCLVITCQIENTSKDIKIDYDGWTNEAPGLLRQSAASLTDHKGNNYRPVTYGFFSEVSGRAKKQGVLPGAHITDALTHEKPIPGHDLLLALPLAAFDNYAKSEEVIYFRIPAKMVGSGQNAVAKAAEPAKPATPPDTKILSPVSGRPPNDQLGTFRISPLEIGKCGIIDVLGVEVVEIINGEYMRIRFQEVRTIPSTSMQLVLHYNTTGLVTGKIATIRGIWKIVGTCTSGGATRYLLHYVGPHASESKK